MAGNHIIRRTLKQFGLAAIGVSAKSIRKILPGKAMAIFIENTSLVEKLDYEPHNIWLNVQSRGEYETRLISCSKEPETIQWIEKFIRPGDVMFDIGANVGAYSLVASKVTGGEAQIFAFEPAFTNYPQLCQNILLNGCSDSIVPLPLALSDKTGLGNFYYQNIAPGGSLHAFGEAADFKGDTFDPVFHHTTVSYSMDDFVREFQIPHPNHIKMDVDGIEAQIVKGAVETLANPLLRTMLVEVEPRRKETSELLKTLDNAGFDLHSRHLQLFVEQSGNTVESYNYIFVRR